MATKKTGFFHIDELLASTVKDHFFGGGWFEFCDVNVCETIGEAGRFFRLA